MTKHVLTQFSDDQPAEMYAESATGWVSSVIHSCKDAVVDTMTSVGKAIRDVPKAKVILTLVAAGAMTMGVVGQAQAAEPWAEVNALTQLKAAADRLQGRDPNNASIENAIGAVGATLGDSKDAARNNAAGMVLGWGLTKVLGQNAQPKVQPQPQYGAQNQYGTQNNGYAPPPQATTQTAQMLTQTLTYRLNGALSVISQTAGTSNTQATLQGCKDYFGAVNTWTAAGLPHNQELAAGWNAANGMCRGIMQTNNVSLN